MPTQGPERGYQAAGRGGVACGGPLWRRSDVWALLALTSFGVATALLLGVHGEFPISDDWAYEKATRAFLETGRIERIERTWVPLVTNTLLGSGFAAVFGLSFEALRLSNLFAAWTLLLASYALLRELGGTPRQACFGAALVAWNPITLVLAFTYMSDVVFTACVAACLALCVRALRRDRPALLAAGLAVALAASLSRHFGLALLVAIPAVALLGRRPLALRATALGGAVAMGAGFLLALATFFGGADTGRMAGAAQVLQELREPWLGHKIARNGLAVLCYVGVFLAPAALWRRPPPRGGLLALACAGLSAVLLAAVSTTRLRMPFVVDIVNPSWFGWITLAGAESLEPASPLWWWAVAALGLTAGLYLATATGLALWRERAGLSSDPRLLLLAFPAVYLGVLALRWPFFDRYLVPLLPPLVGLALLPGPPRGSRAAARALGVAGLLMLAGLGIAGTRDNLTHHRERWVLLAPLLERGVSPRCIDGGSELAGWLAYDPARRYAARRFVHDDAWLLTLGPPREGYEVEASRTYQRLLPWRRERILLLRRTAPPCSEKAEPAYR